MFAEGMHPTIEARIDFSEGPSLRLFTDGSHTCLVDEAGQPWFFRISADEFECGFKMPGSTIGRHVGASVCKARGLGSYLTDQHQSPR